MSCDNKMSYDTAEFLLRITENAYEEYKEDFGEQHFGNLPDTPLSNDYEKAIAELNKILNSFF